MIANVHVDNTTSYPARLRRRAGMQLSQTLLTPESCPSDAFSTMKTKRATDYGAQKLNSASSLREAASAHCNAAHVYVRLLA